MLGSWLVGCEARDCTEMGCVGYGVQLALVDESGKQVAAKGEYRSNAAGATARDFDCTETRLPLSHCQDGLLELGELLAPDLAFDVRFRDDQGDWTAWSPVAVTLSEQTDPDFNGPGCPCTWYAGTAEPLLVPVTARSPAPAG